MSEAPLPVFTTFVSSLRYSPFANLRLSSPPVLTNLNQRVSLPAVHRSLISAMSYTPWSHILAHYQFKLDIKPTGHGYQQNLLMLSVHPEDLADDPETYMQRLMQPRHLSTLPPDEKDCPICMRHYVEAESIDNTTPGQRCSKESGLRVLVGEHSQFTSQTQGSSKICSRIASDDSCSEPVVLSCNHIFGKECISRWFLPNHFGPNVQASDEFLDFNDSCPMCHRKLFFVLETEFEHDSYDLPDDPPTAHWDSIDEEFWEDVGLLPRHLVRPDADDVWRVWQTYYRDTVVCQIFTLVRLDRAGAFGALANVYRYAKRMLKYEFVRESAPTGASGGCPRRMAARSICIDLLYQSLSCKLGELSKREEDIQILALIRALYAHFRDGFVAPADKEWSDSEQKMYDTRLEALLSLVREFVRAFVRVAASYGGKLDGPGIKAVERVAEVDKREGDPERRDEGA